MCGNLKVRSGITDYLNYVIMDTKIGEVVHYFNNIGVAVIELDASLSVGDTVSFVAAGGEERFQQEITSMEIDEEQVDSAKAGDEVAVKVQDKAKAGTEVYK